MCIYTIYTYIVVRKLQRTIEMMFNFFKKIHPFVSLLVHQNNQKLIGVQQNHRIASHSNLYCCYVYIRNELCYLNCLSNYPHRFPDPCSTQSVYGCSKNCCKILYSIGISLLLSIKITLSCLK